MTPIIAKPARRRRRRPASWAKSATGSALVIRRVHGNRPDVVLLPELENLPRYKHGDRGFPNRWNIGIIEQTPAGMGFDLTWAERRFSISERPRSRDVTIRSAVRSSRSWIRWFSNARSCSSRRQLSQTKAATETAATAINSTQTLRGGPG
jgi:hypothetical protein